MTNTEVYLFLDDIRVPEQAYKYTKLDLFKNKKNWTIVRNFEEFKEYIENNTLPYFISFDHDLADSHYSSTMYEGLEAYNKVAKTFTEKTGYDCAVWLVEYCKSNELELPNFYCHSMNPVGKDKINNLLKKL